MKKKLLTSDKINRKYPYIIARGNFRDTKALNRLAYVLSKYINEDTNILCIGTNKVIGDNLGPTVGSLLKEFVPMKIYGDNEYPVHNKNLKYILNYFNCIDKNFFKNCITIDCCIGINSNIGDVIIKNQCNPRSGFYDSKFTIPSTTIEYVISKNFKDFITANIPPAIVYNGVLSIKYILVKAIEIKRGEMEYENNDPEML